MMKLLELTGDVLFVQVYQVKLVGRDLGVHLANLVPRVSLENMVFQETP